MKPTRTASSLLFAAFALNPALSAFSQDGLPLPLPEGIVQVDRDAGPAREIFENVAATRLGVAKEDLEVESLEGPIVLANLGLPLYIRNLHIPGGARTVVALDSDGHEFHLQEALDLNQ